MSVAINGIRGSSAYSGDLSGSFMSPEVVGLKGIAISGLPTSDNDTLLFNSASNQFYFSASAGNGNGGSQGPQGPSGSQGQQGLKGDKGDTGATGAIGPSGSQGPQGIQGIQGPSGSTGPQGPAGPSGSQGIQGEVGPQGPSGSSGTPADLSAYATIASPSVTNLTASNALISNDLSVAGNLTVNGTMTSVNSTNLEITDKYILIASGAADAAALHGAGLQFGTVPSEDARIIYDAVNDEMEIYPAARSAEFRGTFSGSGANLTSIPASAVVGAAITGSNTFVGDQIITGSIGLRVVNTTNFSSSVLSTYPFIAKSAGNASVAIGGTGVGRIEGISTADALGASLYLNAQGGGDVYLANAGTQLIVGTTSLLNSTSKMLVYATASTNNALDAVTGSIQVRSGSVFVTGSIFSTATISGSAISGSFAGSGAGLTGVLTSSYATNAGTAQTASYIATASYATNAGTAQTASYATNAGTAQTASYVATASYATNAGTAAALSGFNSTNPSFTSVTASYFTGSHLGDGSSLTGIPYDIAGEVTGSIVSGSELLNYLSPRAFTMQSLSQYTGSEAATAIVRKNGINVTYPSSVSANDLITIVSNTTGSKAYFTIKGAL